MGSSCAEVIGGYSRERYWVITTVISSYELDDVLHVVRGEDERRRRQHHAYGELLRRLLPRPARRLDAALPAQACGIGLPTPTRHKKAAGANPAACTASKSAKLPRGNLCLRVP